MLIAYSYNFICVYIVSVYANITLITADLLNQNRTKKIMLLYTKVFQLGIANRYLSRVLNIIISDKIIMLKIT